MSRVIYGARVSLAVGVHRHRPDPTVIGVSLGLLAGFHRGWVDTLLSRIDRHRAVASRSCCFGIGLASACAVNGCLGGADPTRACR